MAHVIRHGGYTYDNRNDADRLTQLDHEVTGLRAEVKKLRAENDNLRETLRYSMRPALASAR